MQDFIPELRVLVDILLEKKSYREALFKVNMEEKLSQIGKKRLQENVLGVLRHYFCLSFECQNLLLDSISSQEYILSLITLYALRYHRDESHFDIYHAYYDTFLKNRLLGDYHKNFEILENAAKNDFSLPEEMKNSPYFYNSLVLEFPAFLLKRLREDYSIKRALDIASKAHKHPSFIYQASDDKEVILNEKIKPISLGNNVTIYEMNKPLPIKELKKTNLYPIGYVYALAYSKLRIPPLMPKIFISGLEDGFSFLPIAFISEKYYQSELFLRYENAVSYRAGMDVVKHFHFKKAHVIQSSLELMKTYASYDNFDIVVSLNKDLKMGKMRFDPSILPALNEEMIHKSHLEQLKTIKEDAKFVKPGGYLLFVNHSLVKEETVQVIEEFLKKNKDFQEIQSDILFPDITNSEGGYYCLLKRKVNKHD